MTALLNFGPCRAPVLAACRARRENRAWLGVQAAWRDYHSLREQLGEPARCAKHRPDALGVLHCILRLPSAGGTSSTCSAVPTMRMMSLPMSVTSSPRVTLGFSLMLRSFDFFRPAVNQDRLVVAQQEPHWHAVRLAVGTNCRQPRHQVAVQASLDVLATFGRQMSGQVHGGHHNQRPVPSSSAGAVTAVRRPLAESAPPGSSWSRWAPLAWRSRRPCTAAIAPDGSPQSCRHCKAPAPPPIPQSQPTGPSKTRREPAASTAGLPGCSRAEAAVAGPDVPPRLTPTGIRRATQPCRARSRPRHDRVLASVRAVLQGDQSVGHRLA